MQSLGANSVKLSFKNGTALEGCMTAFADAGIYVWANIRGFGEGIGGVDSAGQAMLGFAPWNSSILSWMTPRIDALSQYSNTAGFYVASEVGALLGDYAALAWP